MSGLDDGAVARRLRQQIDQRARAVLAGALPRHVWGVVTEVQNPDTDGHGGTFSALLQGGTDASLGIRWFQTRPVAGDVVLVSLPPPGGTRYAVAIDREVVAGGTTFDVSTLDGAGLATDAELADHATGGGHAESYTTGNTMTVDNNKWSKIAYGSILDPFGQISGEFKISGNGAAIWPRGTVRFRLKQQAAFGSAPIGLAELINGRDISNADVVIVITSNAGPTTYEIHLRITAPNTWIEFTPAPEGPSAWGVVHAWNPCPPFQAALPAGTQFVATT